MTLFNFGIGGMHHNDRKIEKREEKKKDHQHQTVALSLPHTSLLRRSCKPLLMVQWKQTFDCYDMLHIPPEVGGHLTHAMCVPLALTYLLNLVTLVIIIILVLILVH